MDFVIMMAIAGMPEDKFRQDMFRSKRKPVEETWCGETLGVAEIVRFAPSACNTQPWITENTGDALPTVRSECPRNQILISLVLGCGGTFPDK